ncbi:MAG TPA: hypothetical protein VK210_10700, partial [Terriglobia bacterium]|nr:hypothetical protein [Terriglobia bacterium]
MFAPLDWTLIFLLAGGSTLPNGIRVYEIPLEGRDNHSFEVIAGYRTGVRNEMKGTGGLAAVVSTFLRSTPSARAMAVAAYGAGGEIEFFSDLDRTGVRLKMPDWARPMVEESISEFLSETPQKNPALVDRALDDVRSRTASVPADVRFRIEEQFRIALLGQEAKSDLSAVRPSNVEQFFAKNYGTDRAFVAVSAPLSHAPEAVERRSSETADATNAQTEIVPKPSLSLRIETELLDGAVLLGMPVPSVYYRNWYAFLMMDRLISQAIAEKPATVLSPTLEPYYYRMEVPVPSGQTAGTVEKTLLQELSQMQYARASNEQLEMARRNAIQYLESEAIQRWYVSLGIPERRLEGLQWIREFSADDMRATARDIV